MTNSYTAIVPLSILDGSDGELSVTFDWKPGKPDTGLSGPPENYDPGWPDEFYITFARYASVQTIPVMLAEHERERVEEWLDEHWERPSEDDRADDLRDEARERKWDAES